MSRYKKAYTALKKVLEEEQLDELLADYRGTLQEVIEEYKCSLIDANRMVRNELIAVLQQEIIFLDAATFEIKEKKE